MGLSVNVNDDKHQSSEYRFRNEIQQLKMTLFFQAMNKNYVIALNLQTISAVFVAEADEKI